jgi:hypothetical protein
VSAIVGLSSPTSWVGSQPGFVITQGSSNSDFMIVIHVHDDGLGNMQIAVPDGGRQKVVVSLFEQNCATVLAVDDQFGTPCPEYATQEALVVQPALVHSSEGSHCVYPRETYRFNIWFSGTESYDDVSSALVGQGVDLSTEIADLTNALSASGLDASLFDVPEEGSEDDLFAETFEDIDGEIEDLPIETDVKAESDLSEASSKFGREITNDEGQVIGTVDLESDLPEPVRPLGRLMEEVAAEVEAARVAPTLPAFVLPMATISGGRVNDVAIPIGDVKSRLFDSPSWLLLRNVFTGFVCAYMLWIVVRIWMWALYWGST